jgi:hypothetical protein
MTPDFVERLILAIVGPATASILGTLIIGVALTNASRRYQERRESHEIRQDLMMQMTQSANELNFAIMHYTRALDGRLGADQTTSDLAPILHDQYRKTKSVGHALEVRLRAYFGSGEPAQLWHATQDLLSVRYFSAIGQATAELLESDAGPEHSGLSVDELQDDAQVYSSFRMALRRATNSVLSSPMIPLGGPASRR